MNKSYFPNPIAGGDHSVISSKVIKSDEGISIRDKFAESAMQALIIAHPLQQPDLIASNAIKMADELIKQLKI